MLNVHELELRHTKYKRKKNIPYIIIGISLSVIIALVSLIYKADLSTQNKTITKPIKTISTYKPSSDEQIMKLPTQKLKEEIETPKDTKVFVPMPPVVHTPQLGQNTTVEKIVFSPSLDFISQRRRNSVVHYETTDTQQQIGDSSLEEDTQEEVQETIAQTPPPRIEIMRQNTKEDVNHIITRFKKNNNPALSLFVAKKYYELGEYHKAYNYALITNELNDNIDSSWVIFAKSLVKLNEKDEAIKTLKKYIKHSHSTPATLLLKEIISGKFK